MGSEMCIRDSCAALNLHIRLFLPYSPDSDTLTAGGPLEDCRRIEKSLSCKMEAAAEACMAALVERIVRDRQGGACGDDRTPSEVEFDDFEAYLGKLSRVQIALEVRRRLDLLNVGRPAFNLERYPKRYALDRRQMTRWLMMHGRRSEEEMDVRAFLLVPCPSFLSLTGWCVWLGRKRRPPSSRSHRPVPCPSTSSGLQKSTSLSFSDSMNRVRMPASTSLHLLALQVPWLCAWGCCGRLGRCGRRRDLACRMQVRMWRGSRRGEL